VGGAVESSSTTVRRLSSLKTALSSHFLLQKIGDGCLSLPPGAQHHLSPHVPLHPVWQTPVARLLVLIRGSPICIYFPIVEQTRVGKFIELPLLTERNGFSLTR
jgi:hypothetical protein